jgi:GcrA cell cycle regulator
VHAVSKGWSEEDIAMLKELWSAKNSASMIAAALIERTGRVFTRNAVIGKINRLGLQGQGALAPKFRKSKKRKPRAQRPSAVVADVAHEAVMQDLASEAQAMFPEMHIYGDTPARLTDPNAEVVSVDLAFPPSIEIAIPVSDRVTLFDLGPGVCRYPIGDPLSPGFSFCGAACDPVRSYCRYHHAVAYTPIQKQKKVAWRAYR